MSNVKNPQIEFVADYDWISGHFDMEKDRWVTPDDMRGMLADFSSPSFGLRLTYTRSPQFDRVSRRPVSHQVGQLADGDVTEIDPGRLS